MISNALVIADKVWMWFSYYIRLLIIYVLYRYYISVFMISNADEV